MERGGSPWLLQCNNLYTKKRKEKERKDERKRKREKNQ